MRMDRPMAVDVHTQSPPPTLPGESSDIQLITQIFSANVFNADF